MLEAGLEAALEAEVQREVGEADVAATAQTVGRVEMGLMAVTEALEA